MARSTLFRRRTSQAGRCKVYRPRFEVLEDRMMLSAALEKAVTVPSPAGSGSTVSLSVPTADAKGNLYYMSITYDLGAYAATDAVFEIPLVTIKATLSKQRRAAELAADRHQLARVHEPMSAQHG